MKRRTTFEVPRPIAEQHGPVIPGCCPYYTDVFHTPTLMSGAQHRQLCEMPVFQKRTFKHQVRAVVARLLSKLRPLTVDDVPTWEEWLAAEKSDGASTAEVKDLEEAHMTDSQYTGSLPPRYTRGKCHGKNEPYQEPKCLRGICGRHLVFKARWGRFFSAFDKAIVQIEVNGRRVFVKGQTPEQMVRDLAELPGGYDILENDFSSFEASVSDAIMDIVECEAFRFFFKKVLTKERLAELIADVKTSVFGYKTFTGVVRGRRKSGDLWTSTGNGFTNLVVLLVAAHMSSTKIVAAKVEGDDSLVVGTLGASKARLNELFLGMGFNAKMTVATTVWDSVFCKKRCNPETLRVMRDPVEVLAKIGWSKSVHVGLSRPKQLQLVRAKALSLAHTTPGVPILQVAAFVMLRQTAGVTVRKAWLRQQLGAWDYNRLSLGENCKFVPPEPSDRAWCERFYGIPIQTQLAVERELLASTEWEFHCPSLMPHVSHWYRKFYQAYALPAVQSTTP